MAVDVHGVGHHRHVRHPQPHALAAAERQWGVLAEAFAVEAPRVGLHLAVECHVEGGVGLAVGQSGAVGGLELGGQQGLAVEFCNAGVRGRDVAGAGAHDGAGRGALLALGRGLQHEHAVAEGDGRIQSFSHREVDGAGLGGGHREPVGVGDGESMALQGELEDGVGGGVDDAQSYLLPGLGGQGAGRGGDAAVDEVVGVGDVPGVTQG